MRQSVTQLDHFYNAPLGRAAHSMVERRLQTLWPSLDGMDVMGYGYGYPFLEPYLGGVKRAVFAMPADQGALQINSRRGNCSTLVDGPRLPFMPVSFDRVLVAHGLEEAPDISLVLRELWRVMKPEARLVIICANRSGLWARSDQTPFGAGRPFSRSQISRALKRENFVPLVQAGALYSPPLKLTNGRRRSQAFEVFGETVWPRFSGLILIEAVKRLYAEHDTGHKVRSRSSTRFGGALGATGKTVSQQKYQP